MTASANAARAANPRRISTTALVILAAWLAAGGALAVYDPLRGLLTFVFVLLGWLLSVMAHEFGHAYVGYLGGDHTVASKGYLTLDPARYINSATSLVIPLIVVAIGGIGLPGGAVYLRQDLMRSRAWRSASSLAGPAATAAVLVVLSVCIALARAFTPSTALPAALAFLAFLQATALVINLLPVPGLDGYGALRPYLPGALTKRIRRWENLLFMGFVLLLLTSSGANDELFKTAISISDIIGVPRDWVVMGYEAFRFWH